MPKAAVMTVPDQPFEHAYFLESGIGSVVTVSPDGLEAESGLFGWDGFAPTPLMLATDRAPFRTFMQVPGDGYRIACADLRAVLADCPVLQGSMLRFTQVLAVQASYTALSNAVHSVDERLARWLLMCHDRVEGNEVRLTHEFLSLMLAVRRPSVTTALHVLEGNRLISAGRGSITIVNRARLEEFAGDAYGRPEAEYARLFEAP